MDLKNEGAAARGEAAAVVAWRWARLHQAGFGDELPEQLSRQCAVDLHGELMRALKDSLDGCLTDHQREVLVALALNGVPLDVLAEQLTTSRGALYKTLHDARRKLRIDLAEKGVALDSM